MYSLLPYGIRGEIIPVDDNGMIKNERHLDQITKRESIHEIRICEELTEDRITVAKANDVLLGRGKSYQNHEGNQRLTEIVEKRRNEYQVASKHEKTNISKEIVEYVKNEMCGRFLQKDEQDPDYWMIVTDQEGRLKVSHAFRASKNVPSKNTTSTSSETSGIDAEEDGGRAWKLPRY